MTFRVALVSRGHMSPRYNTAASKNLPGRAYLSAVCISSLELLTWKSNAHHDISMCGSTRSTTTRSVNSLYELRG